MVGYRYRPVTIKFISECEYRYLVHMGRFGQLIRIGLTWDENDAGFSAMQVSKSSHQILELVVRSILAVGVHMENIHLGMANVKKSVLRIRIRSRVLMLLGLLDPDPLVRGTDRAPDPGSFYYQAKIVRKYRFLLFCDFLIRGTDPRIRICTNMSRIRNTAWAVLAR